MEDFGANEIDNAIWFLEGFLEISFPEDSPHIRHFQILKEAALRSELYE